MESTIRVLMYVVVGVVLMLADVVFVRSALRGLRRKDLVIAPFQVIGKEQGASATGIALAHMVQSRLKRLEAGVADAQTRLRYAMAVLPIANSGAALPALIEPVNLLLSLMRIRVNPGALPAGG